MSERMPLTLQRIEFEKSAESYLRWLREEHPEHFMESTAQAQQRKIFVACFDLINDADKRVHAYNELLVQWRRHRKKREEIRQVVPDNMVVLHDGELKASGSYDVPLQPARPFWVLEYVSKSSQRKDYEVSFRKYEEELQVPYYLTFYPDNQEMSLYHLREGRYITVLPNDEGRCAIPEIEVEVGLIEGWVRFWHRGKLLPLPAALQRENSELRRKLDEINRKLVEANRNLDETRQNLDETRQNLDETRQNLDETRKNLDESVRRSDRMQEELERLRAENARLLSERGSS